MDHTPIAIGTRTFWVSDEPKLVLLHPEDRAQHLYIVGKTGLGKSTLLRNLILQDLYAGRGVGLLDPHGDLAREVLDAIPKERTNEVLYFNPGDLARPVGLNLLPKVPQDQTHLVVSGVLSAFRGIWGSSWGPRLEYILGHGLAARAFFFLEADRGTMPVVRKGLAQTSFLRKLLAYQETWRRGLHRTHLGIPNFRVLTVTTSRERVKHLLAACHSLLGGGSRLFLFTDEESVGRGDILAREWVNGRGEVVRLLGAN